MKYTNIYVICPGYIATGGPELLHQLVYQINKYGQNAHMVYVQHGSLEIKINPRYLEYITDFIYVKDIVDDGKNLLIVPETKIEYLKHFKKIKTAIWWLSVDFYLVLATFNGMYKKYGLVRTIFHTPRTIYYKKQIKKVDMHFYQSFYAKNFLLNKGIREKNTFYLSDYINDIYLEEGTETVDGKRKNIIVYNPKKGIKVTKFIEENINEYRWIPIENMTMEKIMEILREAKLYVDFGNHPGKDRLPREAAISGCCVITSKNGSAAYYQDLPILNKYKFTNAYMELDDIKSCINDIMVNFNILTGDFEGYRNFIKSEKQIFDKAVLEYFCR